MAGIMRKGISWLGLGPEEDYEDYEDYDDYAYDDEAVVDVTGDRVAAPFGDEPAVRAVPAAQAPEYEDNEPSAVRVVNSSRPRVTPAQPQAEAVRPRSVVRSLPTVPTVKPAEVTPESFNEAQEIGDHFKDGVPVVMNLRGLDRDLARRLLDFASGVSYGLGGSVQKLRSKVYLLTPNDVEVSASEMRRLKDED